MRTTARWRYTKEKILKDYIKYNNLSLFSRSMKIINLLEQYRQTDKFINTNFLIWLECGTRETFIDLCLMIPEISLNQNEEEIIYIHKKKVK